MRNRELEIAIMNALDAFDTPMFVSEDGCTSWTAGPALAYTAMQMLLWLIEDLF